MQSALRLTGYQLNKLREPLPKGDALDVFALCMKELLRKKAKPFILQIGANDGVTDDPVRRFITVENLPALLLEPNPTCFALLQENYASFSNVRMLNIAISETAGSLSLFVPKDDLIERAPRLSGLCTLDRAQLIKELNREALPNPENLVSEIKIRAKTAADLLQEEKISAIDVLQIDTEGHDWKILSQFDLSNLGISLIHMEWFHLKPEEQRDCMNHLTSLGYSTIKVLGDIVAYKAPAD